MKTHTTKVFLFLSLLCILFSLTDVTLAQTPPPAPKIVLRVALFPYIPDAAGDKYAAMTARIESEFEHANPTVDLVLKPVVDDGFYEEDKLAKWLTDDPEKEGYHLVEIDTLLLGTMFKRGLIADWGIPPGRNDWHPAGLKGSTINGKVYGVPHWLCGHFIFSRDDRIIKAKNISELIAALDSAPQETQNITGSLGGSWNLPALFLDALADTYGPDKVSSALTSDPDETVMRGFRLFSKECEFGGKNPCLDGTFDDNDVSAELFAQGKSDAFFGYSERLHLILKKAQDDRKVRIASAPLGAGKHPILFVDSFVMRKDCNTRCREVAAKFVSYINAPKTFEWILMSRDAGLDATPRYLVPATFSAYRRRAIRRNRLFKSIQREMRNGDAYPVTGFPENRRELKKKITEKLK